MFAIRTEGHRALTREPGRELLIRFDKPVSPNRKQDGSQSVKDILSPVWVFFNSRVKTN
jgi:hypothetical protein